MIMYLKWQHADTQEDRASAEHGINIGISQFLNDLPCNPNIPQMLPSNQNCLGLCKID